MPPPNHQRWRPRGRWGPPRRRPDWWPENESWPPQGPEAWRTLRRGFMRRFIGFAVAAIVVIVVMIVGLAWVFSTLIGEQVLTAVLPVVALVIGLLILVRLVRGIWRQAVPLGDLIEASGRVEAGDVGAQVEERGPREVRSLARAFNAMSARLAQDTHERRRLLADVSHELRTPLSVIQGNVEGMIDGLYPADTEHLELVLAETRQMERLIEDLRTLSMADAGALPLHREATDLDALAADVVAGFQPQAAAAGVTLTMGAGDAGIASVDPRRIRQVIGNLVSNALRHTPAGGQVSVRARRVESDIEIEVADSGSGIEPDFAERAFERFSRSGDSPGAGLGLAIVRDLVRAHGGDVSLESAPGEGTTMRCHFPLDSTT